MRGPVSLFFLTLAESGERKTAVDKLLMEPSCTSRRCSYIPDTKVNWLSGKTERA
ncbi:DUF3987 domain-containing protein [Escherichia coli]